MAPNAGKPQTWSVCPAFAQCVTELLTRGFSYPMAFEQACFQTAALQGPPSLLVSSATASPELEFTDSKF